MMVSTGQLASRHLESGRDPSDMGRYSYQTFIGIDNTKLMFITAYRVCFQTIEHVGESTSYFHQWHSVLRDGHDNPNPWKQVLDDLKTTILQAIGNGYDVCVSMDANEGLHDRNQQLLEWIDQCGLISVHEAFFDADYYDMHPVPSTYNRGTTKIDHVLCTPRLLSCIVNVAIEPSNDGIASDQRGLIVDFNTEQLLGHTANISKHKTRVLKSFQRKSSIKYRQRLYDLLLQQNIFGRVTTIIRSICGTQTVTAKAERKAEAIDQYITDCMIKAESEIKVYNDDDFSPEKVKRSELEKLWKMASRAIRTGEPIPTPPMSKIMTKYPHEDYTELNDQQGIRIRLKECRETRKQAVENGKELRQKFLTERAIIASLNGNVTAEAAILQLKQIEASIAVYTSICRVMNPTEFRAGLTMIKVPSTAGTYETIVDPSAIEERLLERNWSHYGQAKDTEMASPEVTNLMGDTGTSKFCDNVLNGSADLSSFSPSLQAIFKQFENPPPVEVSDLITFEDYTAALRL